MEILKNCWEAPLEDVFPTVVDTEGNAVQSQMFEPHEQRKSVKSVAQPRVLIPVFPGTSTSDSEDVGQNALPSGLPQSADEDGEQNECVNRMGEVQGMLKDMFSI